jgi:ABC-type dipeptide/oligopeptide/nickel transport system permease component
MARLLARRLLLTLPVLLGVATLVFSLIHLVPGDPVETMLGEAAAPRDVVALRTRLGLNQPLYVQYFRFLKGAATGDLGISLRTNQPVSVTIRERVPATVELALASMILAAAIAIPIGVFSAARAGSFADHFSVILSLVGISLPNFWLGPLLAILFSIELGWLPVSGRGTFAHLVLPAITLGTPLAALLARITRASVLEELREPYVTAARARGLSPLHVLLAHAFRNSLVPIVTVAGLQFGVLLTGAVITETIFAWPGIGRLLVQSIAARDYPTVQGCVLLIAATYVAVNLLVDVLYGYLDPRIRYA